MLSGESAATLDSARADAADTRSKAHAQANRHNKLLAAGTQPPETRDISKLHLYFQAIEAALSGRPLTVLAPRATGRKHLMLTDPRTRGLPMLSPSLAPGDDDEQIVSPPRPATTDREKSDER